MTPRDEINDREWADPHNWDGWFGAYSSKADDRIWVPKRTAQMGQTLNFAHAAAWWSLLGLSIIPLAFVLLSFLLWLDRRT
jgi:uncharacterized membrane protein